MRERYRFSVVGYVVMPEHVHLLISEPHIGDPSIVVQAVKLGFVRRVRTCPQNPTSRKERETWGTHLHRTISGSAGFMTSMYGVSGKKWRS